MDLKIIYDKYLNGDVYENPKKGIYIHLFQPKEDIYEPGKKINSGENVIKYGKFETGLINRLKGYHSPRYWKYVSNDEVSFKSSVNYSFLLGDFSEYPNWMVRSAEHYTEDLINKKFNVLKKVGSSRTEYLQIEPIDNDLYINIINEISEELNKFKDNLNKFFS